MDTVSRERRAQIMRRITSKGNGSTELAFIKLLRIAKITGWRRNYSLYGRPDFVFTKQKIAVFIDGCFWHGCPKHCRMPLTNRNYWEGKISRNVKRDKSVVKHLKGKGWNVIRFWEHDMKNDRAFKRKIARLKTYLDNK